MPKVSVILTSFNHAKFLRASIDSVLRQSFTDFELIIWDDASTDESWTIINEYQDSRIRAFCNEERTGSEMYGMNKAIAEVAQGKFIAIHHSDDIWEPTKLEKQVTFLDANLEIGAVFTNALVIAEDGSPMTDKKHYYFNIFDQPTRTRYEWLRFFFTNGNALCHPSVLIRKTCHEECGMYRNYFFQTDDFEMWVRLCLKYEIHVLPDRLVRFRVLDNEANISGSRPETRIRGVYEYYKLLQNYRNLTSFEELVKVFPSAAKFCRNEETDMEFLLAMVSLEEKPYTFTQLFGLDLLFEIISDPKRSATIKRLYNFDYKNFIALTAQHDIFSREEVATLWHTLSERDGQLAAANSIIAERDNLVLGLNAKIQEVSDRESQLQRIVADRETQIASLNGSLSDRGAHIEDLNGQIREVSNWASQLQQSIAERDEQISSLNQAVHNSTSWRITAPVRVMKRGLLSAANFMRCRLLNQLTKRS